jgi:AraC-like DNA-binding protein
MSTTLEAVKNGIAFIESHLQHNIGVSDVADAVSYSQFYFSREFSRHTQISVYDYILRRKISEAYKYLFAADIKIIDLAFRYGFQSHEVFTRAFRKMFGENPSEAVLYKPLAVYEAIDDAYLEFLNGLHMALPDEPARSLFFEVDTEEAPAQQGSSLMLLCKGNMFKSAKVFRGRLVHGDNRALAFRLHKMKAILRLYHTDEQRAFRFFFENFFDIGCMGGNYLLAEKGRDHIDFLIPAKSNNLPGV